MTMGNDDDGLLRALLERLDADEQLEHPVALLIFAAFEGENVLREALTGNADLTLPWQASDTALDVREPVGAYLQRITVQGFRGIGPKRSLLLKPGPGLTVVCGRNGSGKSSFAEAAEFALTGHNERWNDDRPREWRSGWRNVHHPRATQIEVELLVEGATPAVTLVRRQWADEDGLTDATADVQRHGLPLAALSTLGWDQALATFRPFLSYNELGDLLSGKPSDLYDALASILGLERIAETQRRLIEAHKALKTTADDVKARAKALESRAAQMNDARARQATTLLSARTWDLEALATLATGDEDKDDSSITNLRTLAALRAPALSEIETVVSALREAHKRLELLRGTDAERCALDADLLDQALQHHSNVGESICPVCGIGALDASWHVEALRRVHELRTVAKAVTGATTAIRKALDAARALLLPAPPALALGNDELSLDLPFDPWQIWEAFIDAPKPPDALADHLEHQGPGFVEAVETLARTADERHQARESIWRPLALDLAAWLADARLTADQSQDLAYLKAAAAWAKATAGDWANTRLKPLAEQSARIWEQLRQESNITLGPVRLEGSATRRRVRLDITVDGSPGSALGMMSQGELHALALTLFLPRATIGTSPFRFLIIDDPVQAMDPSKVDGLAVVLAEVAQKRQVVVFTHDDRLPAAIRHLQLPANILEVTRREGSVVDVVTAEDPARRHLRDAQALIKDQHVDSSVAGRVIPGLCRLAVDAACVDRIRAARLAQGAAHADVEDLIEANPKLYPRMALALFDDPDRTSEVLPRLNRWGSWAASTFKACNSGAHAGSDFAQLRGLVNDAQRLVAKLQQ
jgi:recombinational DNA repair ATPase RecF